MPGEYDHPDHVQVHEFLYPPSTQPATRVATRNPGPAWQPSKLYYTMWSRARIAGLHENFPGTRYRVPLRRVVVQASVQRSSHTTQVPIGEHWDVRVML
ncbi:MAG: hypothetical protein Ct9H300mP12_01960 [Acidimicrobiales bacterium]|nr:MAG: hypothetical protein Ct9H300mP12_01960 [Acidimicrobiales bacterium]